MLDFFTGFASKLDLKGVQEALEKRKAERHQMQLMELQTNIPEMQKRRDDLNDEIKAAQSQVEKGLASPDLVAKLQARRARVNSLITGAFSDPGGTISSWKTFLTEDEEGYQAGEYTVDPRTLANSGGKLPETTGYGQTLVTQPGRTITPGEVDRMQDTYAIDRKVAEQVAVQEGVGAVQNRQSLENLAARGPLETANAVNTAEALIPVNARDAAARVTATNEANRPLREEQNAQTLQEKRDSANINIGTWLVQQGQAGGFADAATGKAAIELGNAFIGGKPDWEKLAALNFNKMDAPTVTAAAKLLRDDLQLVVRGLGLDDTDGAAADALQKKLDVALGSGDSGAIAKALAEVNATKKKADDAKTDAGEMAIGNLALKWLETNPKAFDSEPGLIERITKNPLSIKPEDIVKATRLMALSAKGDAIKGLADSTVKTLEQSIAALAKAGKDTSKVQAFRDAISGAVLDEQWDVVKILLSSGKDGMSVGQAIATTGAAIGQEERTLLGAEMWAEMAGQVTAGPDTPAGRAALNILSKPGEMPSVEDQRAILQARANNAQGDELKSLGQAALNSVTSVLQTLGADKDNPVYAQATALAGALRTALTDVDTDPEAVRTILRGQFKLNGKVVRVEEIVGASGAAAVNVEAEGELRRAKLQTRTGLTTMTYSTLLEMATSGAYQTSGPKIKELLDKMDKAPETVTLADVAAIQRDAFTMDNLKVAVQNGQWESADVIATALEGQGLTVDPVLRKQIADKFKADVLDKTIDRAGSIEALVKEGRFSVVESLRSQLISEYGFTDDQVTSWVTDAKANKTYSDTMRDVGLRLEQENLTGAKGRNVLLAGQIAEQGIDFVHKMVQNGTWQEARRIWMGGEAEWAKHGLTREMAQGLVDRLETATVGQIMTRALEAVKAGSKGGAAMLGALKQTYMEDLDALGIDLDWADRALQQDSTLQASYAIADLISKGPGGRAVLNSPAFQAWAKSTGNGALLAKALQLSNTDNRAQALNALLELAGNKNGIQVLKDPKIRQQYIDQGVSAGTVDRILAAAQGSEHDYYMGVISEALTSDPRVALIWLDDKDFRTRALAAGIPQAVLDSYRTDANRRKGMQGREEAVKTIQAWEALDWNPATIANDPNRKLVKQYLGFDGPKGDAQLNAFVALKQGDIARARQIQATQVEQASQNLAATKENRQINWTNFQNSLADREKRLIEEAKKTIDGNGLTGPDAYNVYMRLRDDVSSQAAGYQSELNALYRNKGYDPSMLGITPTVLDGAPKEPGGAYDPNSPYGRAIYLEEQIRAARQLSARLSEEAGNAVGIAINLNTGTVGASNGNPQANLSANAKKVVPLVQRFATRTAMSANNIMNAFGFESGHDASKVNMGKDGKTPSAFGLFQMVPSTLAGLGYDWHDYYKDGKFTMSAEAQMNLFERHLRENGLWERRSTLSADDLYLAIHFPAAVGAKDSAVLYAADGSSDFNISPEKAKEAYNGNANFSPTNPGLDTDRSGVVTRGELLKKYRSQNRDYFDPAPTGQNAPVQQGGSTGAANARQQAAPPQNTLGMNAFAKDKSGKYTMTIADPTTGGNKIYGPWEIGRLEGIVDDARALGTALGAGDKGKAQADKLFAEWGRKLGFDTSTAAGRNDVRRVMLQTLQDAPQGR
jgi:hypothetical protein